LMSGILLIKVLSAAVSSLNKLPSSHDTSSIILILHVFECDENMEWM
jgi:hypothetical protein